MLAQEPISLKIGELSTKSGVPIKTIRYYGELGLLKAHGRTEGHFRLLRRELTDILQRWSSSPQKQPGAICPNLQV